MKPLDGVTVLDFTQAYSGPYCTVNLADYGARVIKVERLGSGDQTREWAPLRNGDGASGYFALYNRNKEGIAVNMRDPRGVEIIKKIAAKADIVVNNFKVGTLDKLGLGYKDLKEVNPKLVFTSITGYGQDGPLAKLAAYDNVIEATCGLMDQTGFADRQPIRSGASIGDSYTGLMAAFASACAYYNQLNTGEGQTVDVAMQDALFGTIEDTILHYYATGDMLVRQGNSRTHLYSPYDVCQCKDGWVAFSALTQKGFEEFCVEAGREDLMTDERFATNDLRCQNNDALIAEMNKVFAEIAMDEIENKFSGKNFAVAPVIHAGQTIKAKHMADRDMVLRIDDNYVGPFDAVGHPIKFQKTPAEVRKCSPLLGEDTASVLRELGYTEEEIKALEKDDIIQTVLEERIMNAERNFDEVIDRRGTCSYKWYKDEHGLGENDIIPIWTADMDFRCAKPIVDAVVERAQHGLFGYALRDQAHKNCVRNWQTKRYGTTPKEEWMAYAPPGVLFAVNLIVEILTKKGDNIAVLMPNYDPLFEVVTKSERNLVESELIIGEDGSVKIDFADLDKKLAQDVKILIMSNPHNPSGRVWTREELQGIADLAAKHNVFVISDEIHADLVAKDKHHITYYSLGDDVAENSMCCYSANKGFNLGGFQTSTLVIGDQDLKAEFNKKLSIAQTTTDNLFGAVATKAAYTDPECEAWLDDVIEYIDGNKELLYTFVEKNIPQLKVIPSEGTYLAWVDCSGLGCKDGKELEDFFMNKAKVEPCMGYEFGKQGELFVRLNLACPKSTLEKVLSRIKNAIE